ncbi:MAG: C_GCAxxG_C_C family protein [Phycisphaerales bacterium]|nr:MAG: C_GCAxxG_C_C family protein [Phycisphaerales bacterium]
MTTIEQAVSLFRGDCNCSQAILGTYGEELGLAPELACRIACGFGGGMRTADTCGAVTGALMVLGLRYGPAQCEDVDAKDQTYQLAAEFQQRFRSRNGSTICRELLGCDVSTDQGRQEAKEREVFDRICPGFVRDAAEILEQML